MDKADHLKKAVFPLIMSILSLALFLAAYSYLIETSIEPPYAEGLLFLIPFIAFCTITLLASKNRLKTKPVAILTALLTGIMGVASICLFFWITFQAATKTTTDTKFYGRSLKLAGYPGNSLISSFPAQIPMSAHNIVYQSFPAFLQGGASIRLKFDTDDQTVNSYIDHFKEKAVWQGTPGSSEAKAYGLLPATFGWAGYQTLPDDFTVYAFVSKPDQPDNWNHGELSLAAVSGKKDEVIFYAESW